MSGQIPGPGQDVAVRLWASALVELVRPSDLVIADVRTRELIAGPFLEIEDARAAWATLPGGGSMSIMTAGWLVHLASTPRSECASFPLPDVA